MVVADDAAAADSGCRKRKREQQQPGSKDIFRLCDDHLPLVRLTPDDNTLGVCVYGVRGGGALLAFFAVVLELRSGLHQAQHSVFFLCPCRTKRVLVMCLVKVARIRSSTAQHRHSQIAFTALTRRALACLPLRLLVRLLLLPHYTRPPPSPAHPAGPVVALFRPFFTLFKLVAESLRGEWSSVVQQQQHHHHLHQQQQLNQQLSRVKQQQQPQPQQQQQQQQQQSGVTRPTSERISLPALLEAADRRLRALVATPLPGPNTQVEVTWPEEFRFVRRRCSVYSMHVAVDRGCDVCRAYVREY